MRQLIDSGRHSEGRHRASQRKRRLVQAVSVTATVALFAGGVSVANAAPGDVSAASGTFLGGTLLGLDAGLVALIAGETAASTGSADQTESNTLDLTALGVVNIDIAPGVQVPLSVADLGVVGQYASALQSGSSVGASGLISSAGAIGTGIVPAPGVAPGPLSLSLTQAIGELGLPPATVSQVADLDLTVGVTSANASQAAPAAAVGDYEIAGATIDFSSPTLSGVIGTVQSGVGTLQTTVDGLDSALNGALSILNVLGVVDVGVDIDTTSLWTGVSGLLTGDITDPAYPGVTVNLENGTVSVDLDQLHPLNGQPANTDILTPAVIAQIEASVLGLVEGVLDDVTTTLVDAVRGLHVGGGATILGADILTLDTSVGAILDGDTSGITLLGLGLGLPGGVSAILDALAAPLDSLITSITDLGAAALAPINDELLPALSPILSGVLSLQVNNQQTTASVFSETALRVTVLPQLSALTLDIANATVGPNALAAPVAPTLTGITPASGPVAGGTVVTLTGTGFMGATTVTIGGVTIPAGSVTINSPTSLTFTTPAHAAGSVDVTAATPGGPSGPQTFTYLAAPTVTAIAPDSGPDAGGTSVTVTGTGFVAGATTVTIGGVTIPAGSVTVNSATSLTFATPAHAEGAVTVTVTTPGGPSGPQTFTFVAAPVAPTLTGINPVSGPVAGGTVVTLTGTGFTGATAVTFGADAATSFTVNSDTSITATSPAHAAGPVDVTVTTAGGPSGPQTFTFVAAPAAPTLTGINPVSGPVAGGTVVTLTGTGFTGATAVTFGADAATSFTVDSDTSITATSPAHAAGQVDVTVTTAGGPSGPQTFTYVATPTLTGINPVSGPVAGGTVVTLTGTGFTGATAVTFGTDAATSFTVNSDTSITATSPAHAAGPVDVTVTTPGGPSGPQTFTFVAAPAAPTLTGIAPVSGPVAGGTVVTLTGTGFTGATAVTFGTDAATSFTVDSDTSITATSPAHAAGPVDVTVTTPGGPSGPRTFTFVAAPVAPTLTGINPVSGPVAGGTVVTLTGTGFTGATAVTFGTDAATSFTVDSDTSITATSPAHAAGPVDVTVTTPGGPSGPQTFTYVAAPTAPTVLSLSPTHGPSTGGTVVTIVGSGFSPSDAVLIGGATVVPTMITPGTITFVAPAHVPGAVTVVVEGPGGDSGALSYDYDPVTTIGTIDPGEGPEAGGTTITITGSCFTGATGVLFDLTPATSFTVVSDTEITAVVPPGSPGTASVTVIGAPLCGNGTDPDGYEYLAAPDATGILPAEGSELGGTIVEITGTGFTGATAVSFDGIAATQFTVNSDSSIMATTPAHVPGVVDAVVTGPGGASGPLGFTFTAEPVVPGAEIDTVDPGTGPESGGNTVTITGSCFAGATAVLFGGTPATSFTVVNDTTITAVVPAGTAGMVDVTVVGSATCGTATDPGGYEYVAPPIVSAIAPDNGPETGGTVVTLTGEGFTGATSVTIDGAEVTFTVVDDSTITFTTPAHGPGEVDVVVTGPGGASDPVTFTYTAVPPPGATATPAAIAKTGFDAIGGLLAALALVLSGAVLFLVRRRTTA